MASFYPFNKDGQLAGRVPASLRAGAARQESEVRKQASPPTPSQLLHRALIAKENSSEDVLRIAGERLCELDANNCATAIHKAAQFCRRAGGAAKVSRDPRLHGVMDTAVPFTDSWSSRQLCHVAWSMAVLSMGGGGRSKQLLDLVCEGFGRKVWQEGVPQDMSTFAWSLAALLVIDSPVFDVTMRASMERLSEFGVQDLAISAWSVTKLLYTERRPILAAIATESVRKLQEFGGRNLSSLSWAYATAQHRDLPLFAALVSECTSRISELGAQELPITLWALAVSGYPADSVFQVASDQAARSVNGMDVSHICNIAWASARAGPRDEFLLGRLAEAAMERVGELEPLHLANLCWSFANVSRSDELNDQRKPGFRHPALFEALARAASRLAGGLLPQHHASTLWAFAVCEVRSGVPALIDAMLPAMRARLKEYEPRQAAGMLWAVAVLSQHHQPLIDFLLHAVCHTGTEGLVRDGPAHLASIVWAAARLPRTPGLVEQALGHRRLLAAELAGSAAELSEGRRQNIAAVVRSMYEMGLSQAAAALLNDFEALGLMSPGVEAWSAWLWGAASIGDAQLEATAWSGLAASCDGIPRSTFVLNAAAARALAAGREDLARWALTLLQQEGECDMVTNQLRNRVGLGADTISGDWARGEYSKELSLVRHLCSATPPQCPAELLKAAEASKNWEILQLGAGQRGAALDAALALLPKRRCVVVELGCGVGCASMRAAVRLASSGGLVIACDADPVRSAAAICLNEWAGTGSGAGKFGNVDVRVGRGEQLLPQLRKELGPRSVDMLILGGFQGTEYQEELVRALELDLLAVDGSVVADRVLEPMAPGLLWLMQSFQDCFAVVTDDDWVVIATAYEPREGLAPPEAVLQLRHSADEARRRSLAWRYRNRMVAGPTLATQEELEAAQAAYQKLGILPKLRQPMRSGDAWRVEL